jgi:hypothetical protein
MPVGQVTRGSVAQVSESGAGSNASVAGASSVAASQSAKATSTLRRPAFIDNVSGRRQANGIRESGISSQQVIFLSDSDRSTANIVPKARREFETQINKARELTGNMPQRSRSAKLLDLLYQQTGSSYNITDQLPKTVQHIPKDGDVPFPRIDIKI